LADDHDQKSHQELVRQRDLLGSALAESERVTAGILAIVPAGVVHVQSDGAVRTANVEALRVLGLSFDELTNRYTADFEPETVYEDGSPCGVADYPVTKALVTGQAQGPTTIGVRRPDGETSWCIFRAAPVKDDADATTGAIVTITDITERKREEEERAALLRRLHDAERLEAIGRLAGGVAHDFNNLLTVIVGGLELHEQSLKEPMPSHLAEIESAARQAANLTRQLLAFGRRQELEPRRFDLSKVIDAMEPMLRGLIGHRIAMDVDCHHDAPAVHADPNELERVVVNLVANARDALPSGGNIRLCVTGATIADDPEIPGGTYTELSVSDNGAGIDEAIRPHIFEPFFTTKHDAGTGLGLATVHGIVKQSGGFLRVTDRPEGGTTFRVLLPACDDQAPIATAPPLPAAPTEVGQRVLVVEDEPAVRRVVRLLLADRGFDVVACASPNEALALADEELRSYALVVSDVTMPGMSGPDLAAALTERAPALRVLFMSGHVRSDKVAIPAGSRLLRKPFTADTLFREVALVLDDETAGA